MGQGSGSDMESVREKFVRRKAGGGKATEWRATDSVLEKIYRCTSHLERNRGHIT